VGYEDPQVIPLRDTIPSRTAPVVTVALIAVNVIVFLHEAALGPYLERFVFAYGLVPKRLVHWPGDPLDPARFLPLFTSMFWHGGWLHLIGNMLYLWIFGDNVEDRLGHLRFLVFYVVAGAAAGITHVVLSPTSNLPTVGASGAIAGVLGAYIVLFPRARVTTLIPIFVFITIREIPAILVLGFWFVLQLFVGVASVGATTDVTGGVAVFAHIGGFIAGMILIVLMGGTRRARPAVQDFWS
jgi:membrane associated rhomboid family serine protease